MSEHVKDRLTAYQSEELGPGDSERIRVHLESCTECRLAYEEHVRFEALLAEATYAPEPSHSLWPGVVARLHTPAPFRFTFRLARGMVLAGAVGIVISLMMPMPTPPAANDSDLWSTLNYGLRRGAKNETDSRDTPRGLDRRQHWFPGALTARSIACRTTCVTCRRTSAS